MAVYVDDMRAPYGRMIMCHMIADSHEELMTFAQKLKLSPRWLQDAGTYREHFDVCLCLKAKAIHFGAIPITQRQLAQRLIDRRMDVCPEISTDSST